MNALFSPPLLPAASTKAPLKFVQFCLGHPLWMSLFFLLAYTCVDALTNLSFSHSLLGIPWNPQAALAVTLLLVGGFRYIPIVLGAVFISQGVLHSRLNESGIGLTLICLATPIIYGGIGIALRRWTRWGTLEIGLGDLTAFISITASAALLVALIHAFSYWISGALSAGELPMIALNLFTAEALGLIVVLPILLKWLAGGRLKKLQGSSSAASIGFDTFLFTVVIIGILVLIFFIRPFNTFHLLVLPMIAVAMRYGILGTALALLVIQLGVLVGLALFVEQSLVALEFQLRMFALAVTALYLGTLASERVRVSAQAAAHEAALREKHAALSEAQRSASTAELAAAVAHDLNQPLSAIGTYARACRLLSQGGESQQATLLRTLDLIEQQSARAGQYVRRMRDFFRTGTLHVERIEVNALIENARMLIADRLKRGAIKWTCYVAADLPPVYGDALQIGAVLGNLLGNACDALQQVRGRREINLNADAFVLNNQRMVRIRIADSGPGVPPELREQLFRPLATSKPHGMGLGLALSRSLAARQQGRLWFDAEAVQTTFCLDLPSEVVAQEGLKGRTADSEAASA